MISVTVKRDQNKRIRVLSLSGHSGYAESGKDVVCSAVSAVAQTALMGLMHYYKDISYERDEKKGYLSFSVPQGEEAQVIVETAVIGIKDIASGYGPFVKVEEK